MYTAETWTVIWGVGFIDGLVWRASSALSGYDDPFEGL
jgi:hypothetical protein